MPIYSYDIAGYKNKKLYTSLTELRRDYMRSDVSKKYGKYWVHVQVDRKDGTGDYVGQITSDPHYKHGIWQSITMKGYFYIIDKDGKLTKQANGKYPKKYDPYM